MSIPYLPLYVADYEADTAHLSLEEDGAYTRLLRLCWRTPGCTVPNDPDWIMRRLRVSQEEFDRVVQPVINEFFTTENGKARLFSKRLLAESHRIEEVSKRRSDAGKKGGRPPNPLKTAATDQSPAKANTKANGKHLDLELEPEEERGPKGPSLEDEFAEWYSAFPKHVGKGQARRSYRAARQKADAATLLAGAQSATVQFAGSDPKFIPHPATWLNGERWLDQPTERTRSAGLTIDQLFARG